MSDLAYRLMATAGVVCISFVPILVRASDDAGDVTIAFFRFLYALPILLVLYWGTRHRDRRPRRSRMIAAASGVFIALDLTFWHASIGLIGAGLATVVANLQVVIVALIAWAVLGEKPGRGAIWPIPLVLVGIVLISGAGSNDAYGTKPGLGALLSLLAAFFYSAFVLGLRQANRGHDVVPTGPLLDSTIGAAIASLIIGLAFSPDFSLEITWRTHRWILLIALISQVLGWLLISRSLPNLPAIDTSVLLLGQPLLAIIWARLIYSETFGTSQWIGAVLVLAGLVLFSLRRPSSRPLRQQPVKTS